MWRQSAHFYDRTLVSLRRKTSTGVFIIAPWFCVCRSIANTGKFQEEDCPFKWKREDRSVCCPSDQQNKHFFDESVILNLKWNRSLITWNILIFFILFNILTHKNIVRKIRFVFHHESHFQWCLIAYCYFLN